MSPASPIRLALACGLACLAFACAAGAADPAKVLRIAVTDIDTLDPQQYSDEPSFSVIQALFEPAFEWDYLSRTPKLVPLTAAEPVEIADGGRVWTIRLKPGIRFVDDPAFGGKPRELVAEDYVYSYKRWLDPNGRRGGQPVLTDLIDGARPVVDAAKKTGKFDYDVPMPGLRALDRYTLQIRLREPNYPNMGDLVGFVGAAAREVVEAARGDIRARPVGTGPYRLKEWKRGSRLVLEANPAYRDARFPESRDPEDAALVASMRGKRVPIAGVVEANIVDEDLTRLLLFEKGGLDFVQLRGEIATRLLVDGKLAPEVAARGITRQVHAEPFLFALYMNTKDPILGGMGNERVALRRAIAMGWDTDTLIRVVLAGQAMPAVQFAPPGTTGHDPTLPAKSVYDPATANALLDRFGYAKRDSDGYRRAPDGRPVTLTMSLRTGGVTREIQTLWKKNMDALGLRTAFELAPFQEIIKNLEHGRFQMYQGGFGGSPSGYNEFAQLHGVQPQRVNTVQFANDEYDRAAAAFLRAGSDEEQVAAARVMNGVARTYMPILPVYFRLESSYVQPWLLGFRPQKFSTYWKYLDVDPREAALMLTLDELRAIPLFAELDDRELEHVAREAADIHLNPGEYAVHEDEDRALFAVVSGRIEATKFTDGVERHVGWRGPGIVFGEVPITLGSTFPAAFRAVEDSRVLKLEARQYHALAAAVPSIAQKVGALAKERIGGLQEMASRAPEAQAVVIGDAWEGRCHDLRHFLARNQVPFDWYGPDAPEVAKRWPGQRFACADGPTLALPDGTLLPCPPLRDVAGRLGLQTRGRSTEYDTIIVGGGPAGLAAAVYGASEGLRTLVVEREAPGGQAGTSSRIENYLGFPNGVSGDELAMRALQQAKRLGAEILVTRAIDRLVPATRDVVLDGGEVLRTRTVILATGVSWRRLAIDGFDKLIGKGVYYGASRSEAPNTQGRHVFLIGAGNSAGQAALFFASHATTVTLLVRGDDLAKSMSHYLIEQVRGKPNVSVELECEVTAVHGDTHLDAIDVADRARGTTTTRPCGGLFVFIGADAETSWLPPEVTRDARGYVLTGAEACKAGGWPRKRDPYLLETSVPGVFACGDVRASPVKRVASAVGEGSMAIAFVHQFLAHDASG